jgi:lactate permease
MDASGSMKSISGWLNTITQNKVAQLMIIGWAFPFLIEGASGFGTPAALAAPILVGLGFQPLSAAIMVLIMNTVPVSFGAVGTPTWFGFSAIDLSGAQILQIGIKSAIIHGAASLVIPVLALRFVVSWDEIIENIGFIYLSIACAMVPYIMVAFWNYEFPALVGGSIGLIGSCVIAARGWGLKRVEGQISRRSISVAELIKASFPLWGTVALLVITRIPQIGIKALLTSMQPALNFIWGGVGSFSVSASLVVSIREIFGTTVNWSHMVLYVPSLLPFGLISLITFALYRMNRNRRADVFRQSVLQMKAPAITLLGALVFVKLMMMGDDISAVTIIGNVLANTTGSAWYYFAAVLGAVGSFFSGSCTISNLTFGPIQHAIAQDQNLNITTILALQSVGGAMGNMVCINNIVAVCSVLAISKKEGYILIRTVRILILYALIAAGASIFMG